MVEAAPAARTLVASAHTGVCRILAALNVEVIPWRLSARREQDPLAVHEWPDDAYVRGSRKPDDLRKWWARSGSGTPTRQVLGYEYLFAS